MSTVSSVSYSKLLISARVSGKVLVLRFRLTSKHGRFASASGRSNLLRTKGISECGPSEERRETTLCGS
jgi:hypothetical protein